VRAFELRQGLVTLALNGSKQFLEHPQRFACGLPILAKYESGHYMFAAAQGMLFAIEQARRDKPAIGDGPTQFPFDIAKASRWCQLYGVADL